MGQGLETFLGNPAEASTLEGCLEAEFVRTLVCQAGLVMAGEKPAAVFGFTPRAWKSAGCSKEKRGVVARLLAVYAAKLAPFGVCLAGLARKSGGLMLLAWRPAHVSKLLASGENRAFLAECGLSTDDPRALMGTLARRLRVYYQGGRDFPHEIGLVLGYPVEDVRAFLADGGRGAKAVGRWRCYGDVDAAVRRFEELTRLEKRCKHLYLQGVPVTELLRMGARAA